MANNSPKTKFTKIPNPSQPQDDNIISLEAVFNGKMIPTDNELSVGYDNYLKLRNFRYTGDDGIDLCNSNSKANTTRIGGAGYHIYSGIHFSSSIGVTQPSAEFTHVLVQAKADNSINNSTSAVYESNTQINNITDHSFASIHTDATNIALDSFLGMFSKAPQNNIAYCNQLETLIYGGQWLNPSAVVEITPVEITANMTADATSDYLDFHASPTSNWDELGFYTGQYISITSATNTLTNVQIISIDTANDRIYLGSNIATQSDESTVVTAETSSYINPVDQTKNILSYDSTTYFDVGNTGNSYIVLSDREITGIRVVIAEANASSTTLKVYGYDGYQFVEFDNVSDGTDVGGVSLAQSGTITFSGKDDFTDDSEQKAIIEGLYLYAYKFELPATSSDPKISQILVQSSIQAVKDVWDGVYRQPILFQVYDASATAYIDYTLEVNQPSDQAVVIGANLNSMQADDYILMAFENPIAAIDVSMYQDQVNATTSYLTVQPWDGTQWVTDRKILENGTYNQYASYPFNQSGRIKWETSSGAESKPITINGVTGYFYKIVITANLSTTDIIIDTVKGIPAPYDLQLGFVLPALYKNRLFLCGLINEGQANRMDYSATFAPQTFNGKDSSDDGRQSIYIGNNDPIIAAGEIFNRLNSSLVSSLLICKKNETYLLTGSVPSDFKTRQISSNVGCIASRTFTVIDLAQIGLEDTGHKNIAFWLSATGPVMFEGGTISNIPGLDYFFNPQYSFYYINISALDYSAAWFDYEYAEWNLIFPAGTTSSTDRANTWMCYSIKKRKWFEKTAYFGYGLAPISGFNAKDRVGTHYVYNGSEDGYMLLAEDPSYYQWMTKSTGTRNLDQIGIIETGLFLPNNDFWNKYRLIKFKLIFQGGESQSTDLQVFATTDILNGGEVAEMLIDYDSSTPSITVSGGETLYFYNMDSGTPNYTMTECPEIPSNSMIEVNGTTTGTDPNYTTINFTGSGQIYVTDTDITSRVTHLKLIKDITPFSPATQGFVLSRTTSKIDYIEGWAYKFVIKLRNQADTKPPKLIGWAAQFVHEREDD